MSSWINMGFLGGIALQDLRHREIRLLLLAAYLAAGIPAAAFRNGPRPLLWLADLSAGMLLCGLSRISRGGIGTGDGLTVLGAGLMTGITETVSAVLAALVLCTAAGTVIGVRRGTGWKTGLPFTPFLALAFLVRTGITLAGGI